MKISVVIPAFNAAEYLEPTLQSIKRQRGCDVEVILSDGGSSDGTVRLTREWFPDAKIISERDHGQLDAVQKGIRIATGDIVLWMNADDIVMPGAFEHVVRQFGDDESIDLVFSDNYAFDEDGRVLSVGPTIAGLNDLDYLLFYRQMYSECVYWRREITTFRDSSWYDLRSYTDFAFFINLRQGRRCKWTERRLGAFRIRPGQASQVHRDRARAEFARIKQDAWEAKGWGLFQRRWAQICHFPSFWVRQKLRPAFDSAIRKAFRVVEADRTRKELAAWFFDHWIALGETPEQRGSERAA